MSIDVSLALKNEGVQYPFSEKLELGVIECMYGNFETEGATAVSGTLVAMEGEIYLEGEIEVALVRLCDRCADEYKRSYHLEFKETFTGKKDGDESENYTFADGQVDLVQMVEDYVVLQVPTASLCSEDCKGLCPVCGVNLNRASCNCGANDQSGPFGMLAGLMDRD
ncbi:MAG: DUF177 domain-containing protein [Clostridia bacterium]|nr:DUF177 domain-containing protein [Clostridia bacterium]